MFVSSVSSARLAYRWWHGVIAWCVLTGVDGLIYTRDALSWVRAQVL
jgi:hypothetical protein